MKWATLVVPIMALCGSAIAENVPQWQQMQQAVLQTGNLADVKRLLDSGFDPNGSIGCGEYPPILGAVEKQNIPIAKLLLERGAKIPDQAMLSACNTYGLDSTLVALLLDHGGNVNAADGHSSCLHEAVWHRNESLVSFLVHCPGVDLNLRKDDGPGLKGTPLLWALRQGATEVAMILLQAGADPRVVANDGTSAADLVRNRMQEYRILLAAIDEKSGSSKGRQDDGVDGEVASVSPQ